VAREAMSRLPADGISAAEMIRSFESRPSILDRRPPDWSDPPPPEGTNSHMPTVPTLQKPSARANEIEYFSDMYRRQGEKLQGMLHQSMRDKQVLAHGRAELQQLATMRAQLNQKNVDQAIALSKGQVAMQRLQQELEQHRQCHAAVIQRVRALQADADVLRAAIAATHPQSSLSPQPAAKATASLPELEEKAMYVDTALRSLEADALAQIRETPSTLDAVLQQPAGQAYNPLDALSAIAEASSRTASLDVSRDVVAPAPADDNEMPPRFSPLPLRHSGLTDFVGTATI